MTKELQQWAEQLGWKAENDYIWGDYSGYLFGIRQLFEGKQYEAYVAVLTDEQRDKLTESCPKGGRKFVLHGKFLSLIADDVFHSIKREETRQEILDFMSNALSDAGVSKNPCYECQTASSTVAILNNKAVYMCNSCLDKLEQQRLQKEHEWEQTDKRYGRGTIGAMLGALAGTIPLLLTVYYDNTNILLFILVGVTSALGYISFGGIVGRATNWIVFGSVVISVMIAGFVDMLLLPLALASLGMAPLLLGKLHRKSAPDIQRVQ